MIKLTELKAEELKSAAVVVWWQARQTTKKRLIAMLELIANELSLTATGVAGVQAMNDSPIAGIETLLAGAGAASETKASSSPTEEPTEQDWRKSSPAMLWILTASTKGVEGIRPEIKKAHGKCKLILQQALIRGMRT